MVVLTTSATNPIYMYDYVNTYALSPMIFAIIILILIIYFAAFSSLGKNDNNSMGSLSGESSSSSSNGISNIVGIIIVIILVVLIIINAFQYFLNVNITAYVSGFFNPNVKTKHVDIVVNKDYKSTTVPEIKFRKQVFNVPGNYYNYENAKAICSAYGANLATYKQLETAYNNGAEWCNYGWSQDQLALFPTQQQTYDRLQTIDGHHHDCGRPGINGGYIANPEIKFGVNCYGYKPKINEDEEDLMKTSTPYPETAKDLAFQKRVDYWKTKVNDILVSPFNQNQWGETL
jgi:uncharacterized protein YxeA